MITIIHGDDLKGSRNYLSSQREESDSVILLDGNTIDLTSLTQALAGDGLFEENKTVFIEQLLNKKKKSIELDELLLTLKSYPKKNIFLWEGKELDKRSLSLFPQAAIKPFKLPQVLFMFLDNLRPGNGKQLLPLFHQALLTQETELLFSMLVRQLRLLIAVGSKSENPIDEIKRMAPWQEQKLKKQRQLFTQDELLTLYNRLFEIDLHQKTGKLAMPLSSSIDILLLKL